MVIKNISTVINGMFTSLDLPDAATISLKGSGSDYILYVIESLLANDFTSNFAKRDIRFGINRPSYEGVSTLVMENGQIVGQGETVQKFGKPPLIHCIRHIKDGSLRSFIVNDKNDHKIGVDLLIYSDIISKRSWVRLSETINMLLGFKFMVFSGSDIVFNDAYENDWSSEARMVAYMLLSECFITPENHKRVLLLSEISLLSNSQRVKLLGAISSIEKHGVTITCATGSNIGSLSLEKL